MAYGGIMGKGLPGNVLKSQVVSGGEPIYTQVNINLSTKNEGDIITLPEDSKSVEFYVAKKDYEPGLNGTGRVLLVRKDCYDLRVWNSTNVNAYATSDIDSWLNSDYKAKFPLTIQTAMGTTKFYYTPGNGNWNVSTLERSVFIPSLTEIGLSINYANVEGTALPIANLLKIVNYNNSAAFHWTRSPHTGMTTLAVLVTDDGMATNTGCYNPEGSQPIFTLPNNFTYTYYADSAGNAYEEQAYSDASYQFVNQAGVVMPIAQIETGSYVGTGGYNVNSPTVLTFGFEPKVVFIADAQSPNDGYKSMALIKDSGYGISIRPSNNAPVTTLRLTWSGNTLSFYANTSNGQLNQSGITYRYVAIG